MKDALLAPLFSGPALTPVLDSHDFDQWRLVIEGTLGDHRSTLRSPSSSFRTRVAIGQAGPLQVLHLQGQGQMELQRIQEADKAVLWLPLQGWSQERINGRWETAEPGEALLMRPGDGLEGITSLRLEGLSIVLPPDQLHSNAPARIGAGRHNRALVRAAPAPTMPHWSCWMLSRAGNSKPPSCRASPGSASPQCGGGPMWSRPASGWTSTCTRPSTSAESPLRWACRPERCNTPSWMIGAIRPWRN